MSTLAEVPAKPPQKRYYRQRAHVNPLSDKDNFDYAPHPDLMDWSKYYPVTHHNKQIKIIDIGCGYGGLLFGLNEYVSKLEEKLPAEEKSYLLGLEIRTKVCDYVNDKIVHLRHHDPVDTNKHNRISVIRMNAMKYMPNLFYKGQLEMIFILFADPHFKAKKNKWRITSNQLLSEYAYFMKPNGRVYVCTDVKELAEWTDKCFVNHPLFVKLSDTEVKEDPIVHIIENSTEEGSKVSRLGGDNKQGEKYSFVYERRLVIGD